MKIPLSNIVLAYLHPIVVPCHEDAFALATCLRFNDESLCLFSIELSFKILSILRQKPGVRKEFELCWEGFLQPHQIFSKKIFSC